MPMNVAYLNAVRDHGQSLITHIGLVDGSGVELAGGGYARLAVTWVDSADGVSRPSADLTFTTEAADVVAGWRGFSAVSAGVDYGGGALTSVTFNNAGTYKLLAASTSINHTAS